MARSIFSRRPRRKSFVDHYLEGRLDYGGELWSRGDIIHDLRARGVPLQYIDRWLQGADSRSERGVTLSETPPATQILQ